MRRSTLALALVGLALLPVLAGAQEYRERENRARGELPAKTRIYAFGRARLGITVDVRSDAESDRYGAKINSVLPDSPAEKAGLKAGDIVTRFNNTSLANGEAEEEGESGPGHRLVELARELDPGDSVKIEYRRDGQNHTTTVIAAEIDPSFSFGRGPYMDEFKMLPRFEGPEGGMFKMGPGGGMNFFFDRDAGGLDLVELNGDLGEYFGTSEGLLVTSAPDSSSVLRAGDVILTIDGRKPTSVSQARRILASYEDGETAKLEIMRKHQRMTVEWKVDRPEFKVRQMEPGRMERTHRM